MGPVTHNKRMLLAGLKGLPVLDDRDRTFESDRICPVLALRRADLLGAYLIQARIDRNAVDTQNDALEVIVSKKHVTGITGIVPVGITGLKFRVNLGLPTRPVVFLLHEFLAHRCNASTIVRRSGVSIDRIGVALGRTDVSVPIRDLRDVRNPVGAGSILIGNSVGKRSRVN